MYSIILPIRNEDESLPQLFWEIEQTFRGKKYEVIAVDDASGYKEHMGKWEALRTGIARARGDIVITLDSDLQDDPRELPKLIASVEKGYDMASGWRKHRSDPLYKILLTKLANFLYGYHDFSSPMKVYKKSALETLPKEGSFLRYSFLFANLYGFRTIEIPIVHRARIFGTSKFGSIKYIRILYDLMLITLLFRGSGRLTYRKSYK